MITEIRIKWAILYPEAKLLVKNLMLWVIRSNPWKVC